MNKIKSNTFLILYIDQILYVFRTKNGSVFISVSFKLCFILIPNISEHFSLPINHVVLTTCFLFEL